MSVLTRGAVCAIALLLLLAVASCSGTGASPAPDLSLTADSGATKATAHAHDCGKGKGKHHVECKACKHHQECKPGKGPKRCWKPKCRCKCSCSGASNKPPIAAVAVATVNGSDFQLSPTGSSDPDGTIVKYEWDFESDGVYDVVSTTDGVTSHFFVGGDHTITLRVTDNKGATATATFDLTANFPPIAAISVATTNGTDFSFSADGSTDPEGPIFKYEWDFDNDGIFEQSSFTDPTALHSFGGGDHIVSLRVTDGLDATDTETITVTGNYPPVADIKLIEEIDNSGERDFSLSFAGSSDVEGPIFDAFVTWDGGAPQPVDISQPYLVSTFEGDFDTHTLVLTVRDGLDASSTAMASVSFEGGLVIAIP